MLDFPVVGSVVKMNGQEQLLTVRSNKEVHGNKFALCVWFQTDGVMKQDAFPIQMLEPATVEWARKEIELTAKEEG